MNPAPLLLALLLLALPLASAGAVTVTLEEEGGRWNGEVTEAAPFLADPVAIWVPQGARLQEVVALGIAHNESAREAAASWRAAGENAIRVAPPENATLVRVRFDFDAGPLFLPDYIAPHAASEVLLRIAPEPGSVVESERAHFVRAGAAYEARVSGLGAGEHVRMQVVDEGRVGEVSVLASVVVLALVGLGGALAYHRFRPVNEGRAPEKLVDHLGELQARLMPPIAFFGLLNVVYFVMGLRIVDVRGFPTLLPVFSTEASLAARAFDAFAERLVPAGVQLVVTRPIDAVLAQVEMALFLAFLSTLPLLLYELAAFIGPALLPKERTLALRTLPLVSGLFLGGALFGLLVMAPLMMRTLYEYAPALGATPLLVIQDLVGFAILVLVVFGAAFQLPVVMYALSRFGLVAAKSYQKYWRHAIVALFLIGGLVTPDPSLVSQALVSIPLTLLYLVGIWFARFGERAHLAARE